MAPKNSVWEIFPDLVEKLKSLVGKMSSAKIAVELGHGLTRNAVIGKTLRLGLSVPKAKTMVSAEKVSRVRGKTRIHISNKNYHPAYLYEEVDIAPAPKDLDIPKEQRKTILQLEPYHCRFPVGEPEDPDFFFCGAVKLEGLPYCKHHAQRCYTPAQRRPAPFVVRR